MKRLISVLLLCALVISYLPVIPLEAKAATEGDYTYSARNGEATVTGYTGAGGDITIPDTLGGYLVTAIDAYAFNDCANLTSVTIPDSVTTIGEWAFNACNGLTAVTIPYGVTTIERYAFHWCESLTSVTIPDSVLTIGEAVFNGCDALATVTIGNSVTTIGGSAFSGCPSLTSLTIPDSVTAIGESAFSNCTSLTSVTIPNGITAISNYLFYYCPNLTSVTLPATLVSVGRDAFGECSKLTDVYFNGPENLWKAVSIDTGNACLQNATIHWEKTDFTYDLENDEATITGYTGAGGDVIIPDTLGGCSVTAIGDEAFWGCTSMTSVKIPDTVITIGDYAFCYCTKLTSVTIPDSVKTIGEYAFAGYLDEETGDFASSLTSVTIGSGVTTISADAFSACGKLTSVTIPDNVTRIDYGAFCFCYNLTSVTIGKGVTAIPDSAFRACENLTTVTIPASVTTVGESAFEHCTKLTDVYYDGTQSQWDSITVHNYGNKPLQNATVHFPEPENPDYAYTIEDGKATITKYNGAGGDITIPSTLDGYPVTAIDSYSFYSCDVLVSVTIPDSVTTIGECAFSWCEGLTTVTIPDGVITIERCAFENSHSLISVTIPNSVTTIGDRAFQGCESLMSITIPDGVTTIEERAFAICERLTSLTIPDGVTTIEKYAFYECKSLTSLTIPDSVTSIKDYAFDGYASLKDIYYSGTESKWRSIVIGSYNIKLKKATIHYQHIHDYSLIPGVTVASTCTEQGYTEYTCAFGEKYRTDYVPAQGHVKGTDASVVAPTCEAAGYTVSTCQRCGNSAQTDIVSALGHDYSGKVTIVAPTCTEQGHTETQCIRCTSTINSDYTDSLGHTMGLVEEIPATCTEDGRTAGTACTRCGFLGTASRVSALGHSFTNYASNNDATCTADGTKTAKCNREGCKAEDTQPDVGSKLGHSFTNYVSNNDATCIADGTETAKCDHCDVTDTRVVIGSTSDHSFTKEIIEPTCTSSGYTIYTCACGYTYWDDYVSGLGHSFTNYVSNNDATCKDGTETAKCDRCETTDTRPEVGSAKGHDYETVVSAPTCRDGGFTTYICRRCDHAYNDDWVDALGHSYTNACDTTCNRADCVATRTITHSYTAATCTKAKTCKVCGVTSGKALGHIYKSGVCTRCKYKPAGAKITTQPVNVAVSSGKTAKVSIKATGSGLKYQWYYAKKGAKTYTKASTTNSFSVKMSTSYNGTKAYCVVTDQYGNSVKSNVVTLYKGTPAKIKTQPKGITVANGKTGKLEIKASGSSLKYQWYVKYKGASSFTKVGKSSKTYSFKMASKLDGAQVYCVVKDKYGIEVKSSVVTIKLAPKAKITTQPKSVTVAKGKTAKVTLKATGDGLKYTWYYAKSGSSKFKKASGKSATYSVKMSASVNGRRVYCVVKDKYGNTVKSNIVTLKMK